MPDATPAIDAEEAKPPSAPEGPLATGLAEPAGAGRPQGRLTGGQGAPTGFAELASARGGAPPSTVPMPTVSLFRGLGRDLGANARAIANPGGESRSPAVNRKTGSEQGNGSLRRERVTRIELAISAFN
jgi:hypothetical protein